ncbi:MAG: putative DNA binding domain-containing protein [Butyrivibrio sp.]|uniref:ATP-binding protein n=1 Tax=Butyrivibrio sp. TaxID=28121 RepID=UPI0025E964A3|nr:ATP-binding protein [Butyrivibrio sp.]MCR5769645.1 putative DNA binding domain-containing protein [Butyrivibrio sp.]
MFLEQILNGNAFESKEIECKQFLNRDDIEGWIKTIAGFANADGGTMYIGVDDKTNKLIGFERKQADSERNYFNNQVNEHLSPRPPYKIDFISYKIREKELFIIAVKVEKSPVRPVIVKFRNVPSIYMRREGFTNGATYEEIIEMSISSQNKSFDTLMSDQRYIRDNFSKLFRFHDEHSKGKKLTDKALTSLGFFDENGILANGAVMFSDDYKDNKTEVQCSAFSGFNKGSERIVTVNKFTGCLTDTIEYMQDFITQRMNHTMVKKASSRINIDAYPARALFEGLINAVAHRDYFLDGTQIQVDMFRDRLEISSPGSFFQSTKIEKTYDLSSIMSKRRNELICGILVSCNVMEAAGTGFDKIVEDYSKADEKHRPYIYSTSDHFTLVLPDLTYDGGVEAEPTENLVYVPVPNGSKYDEKILSFCYNNAKATAEITEYLGVSDSSYFRSKILGNLVKNDYLAISGEGRTKYYKTNHKNVGLG